MVVERQEGWQRNRHITHHVVAHCDKEIEEPVVTKSKHRRSLVPLDSSRVKYPKLVQVSAIPKGTNDLQSSALFHFILHAATSLESIATPDDQGQVVGPQPLLALFRVRVGIPGAREHGAALHSALQPLLLQCQLLQFRESVLFGGTVEHRILEQVLAEPGMKDDRFTGVGIGSRVLQFPGVSPFVVQQTWVVVAFVEVFQDGAEDFGQFVGQGKSFGMRSVQQWL